MHRWPILAIATASCASGVDIPKTVTATETDETVVEGIRIAGDPGRGLVDLVVEDGRISAIRESHATRRPRWVVPAVVDAHVHLAYLPRGEELLNRGVAAVVDLAAPEDSLGRPAGALRVVGAGPMLTAPSGYPTRGWGRDGYGLVVRDPDEATAAVDRLHRRGARVVKVPFDSGPTLDDDTIQQIVARAHELDMLVFVHALSNRDAVRAGRLGADVLAHTPVEPMSDEAVTLWKNRAVVTTAAAFGGGAAVVANLRRLREAGTTTLYGTDFGNTSAEGINPTELGLLEEAQMNPAAIIASLTTTPAAFFGFDDLGTIAVGKAASFLILDEDPLVNITALTQPSEVWIDGVIR